MGRAIDDGLCWRRWKNCFIFMGNKTCSWFMIATKAVTFRHSIRMTNCVVSFQVDDQMKLLQHSWSDMLVLDHLHQRMHNNLPDETTLSNGQKFDLLCLGLLGVPTLADLFQDLTQKLSDLKFDVSDYICVKFLLLLNPGKSSLDDS